MHNLLKSREGFSRPGRQRARRAKMQHATHALARPGVSAVSPIIWEASGSYTSEHRGDEASDNLDQWCTDQPVFVQWLDIVDSPDSVAWLLNDRFGGLELTRLSMGYTSICLGEDKLPRVRLSAQASGQAHGEDTMPEWSPESGLPVPLKRWFFDITKDQYAPIYDVQQRPVVGQDLELAAVHNTGVSVLRVEDCSLVTIHEVPMADDLGEDRSVTYFQPGDGVILTGTMKGYLTVIDPRTRFRQVIGYSSAPTGLELSHMHLRTKGAASIQPGPLGLDGQPSSWTCSSSGGRLVDVGSSARGGLSSAFGRRVSFVSLQYSRLTGQVYGARSKDGVVVAIDVRKCAEGKEARVPLAVIDRTRFIYPPTVCAPSAKYCRTCRPTIVRHYEHARAGIGLVGLRLQDREDNKHPPAGCYLPGGRAGFERQGHIFRKGPKSMTIDRAGRYMFLVGKTSPYIEFRRLVSSSRSDGGHDIHRETLARNDSFLSTDLYCSSRLSPDGRFAAILNHSGLLLVFANPFHPCNARHGTTSTGVSRDEDTCLVARLHVPMVTRTLAEARDPSSPVLHASIDWKLAPLAASVVDSGEVSCEYWVAVAMDSHTFAFRLVFDTHRTRRTIHDRTFDGLF